MTNKGSSNKFIVDGQKGTKLDKATIVENMFDTVTKSTGMKTVEDLRKWAEEKVGLNEKKAKFILKSDEVIAELKDGKDNKKSIQIAYNNAKKAIASLKKSVDQCKKNAVDKAKENNKKADTSSYSMLIAAINTALSGMQTVQRVHIRACNVYHSNCRKAAARAVRGVKDVKESYEFDGDTEYAFLQ